MVSENTGRVIQDFVFLCRKIGSINGYFLQVYNKRIYHECDEWIEKIVMITIWHLEACGVMTNSDREEQIFLSNPHTNNRLFSCSPLNATFLYLKKLQEVPEYPEM